MSSYFIHVCVIRYPFALDKLANSVGPNQTECSALIKVYMFCHLHCIKQILDLPKGTCSKSD